MHKANPARRSLRSGPSGPGNTVQQGTTGTAGTTTSTAYSSALTGGTAATNTVVGAHTVLVTLYFSASQSTNNAGCGMSFTANNGATAASGVSLAAGADDHAVLHASIGTGAGTRLVGGSASFLVTTAAGTTTFTGVYKVVTASTCSIAAGHSIIVQVY